MAKKPLNPQVHSQPPQTDDARDPKYWADGSPVPLHDPSGCRHSNPLRERPDQAIDVVLRKRFAELHDAFWSLVRVLVQEQLIEADGNGGFTPGPRFAHLPANDPDWSDDDDDDEEAF